MIKVEGTIKVKESTTETSNCRECGPKTSSREHLATYEIDLDAKVNEAASVQKSAEKPVEIDERDLFGAVVAYCRMRNEKPETSEYRYAAARAAAEGVIALLDERAAAKATAAADAAKGQ